MMRDSLWTRFFNFLKNRFQEFWNEDTAPRMPKRSKERDKEWRALEISQKRSHMVLGALVGIFVVCFLRAGYLQCFNTEFCKSKARCVTQERLKSQPAADKSMTETASCWLPRCLPAVFGRPPIWSQRLLSRSVSSLTFWVFLKERCKRDWREKMRL